MTFLAVCQPVFRYLAQPLYRRSGEAASAHIVRSTIKNTFESWELKLVISVLPAISRMRTDSQNLNYQRLWSNLNWKNAKSLARGLEVIYAFAIFRLISTLRKLILPPTIVWQLLRVLSMLKNMTETDKNWQIYSPDTDALKKNPLKTKRPETF